MTSIEPIERTFAMIKPDAVESRIVGRILVRIEEEGFVIRQMEMTHFWEEQIDVFYEEHIGKPFWPDLRAFMLSGPVVILALERENAVAHWRSVLGATDPRAAAPGTLRRTYGEKRGVVYRNAGHGSDSVESARREIALWWP